MDSSNKAIESTKRMLTTAASLAASAMVVRSLCNEFLPYELKSYLSVAVVSLRSHFSYRNTIVIEEVEHFSTNKMYAAVSTYLATKISASMGRLKVSKYDDDEKNMTISPEQGEEMTDTFEGIQFKWQLLCRDNPQPYSSSHDHMNRRIARMGPSETRFFELSFHKKYKEIAMTAYLPYILNQSQAIKSEARVIKIHMNDTDYWRPINLHHPATFDTIAMDPKIKQEVMDDLARFIKRKDYYKRIGKAWKRGYLLYGPPGTGKSSLVAAMANYLKFDIYDLELTEVGSNSSLRRLLVGMRNKSILVVEDIDCSMELQQRETDNNGTSVRSKGQDEKVTLSGLLNFVDGLWSSCGEERIIVFTTNYKDRLDPALLRPGRMDMHIHMGYCGISEFRVLASNYHDADDHLLFGEIEGLLEEVEVTPAQVAEKLMGSDDKETALRGLIEFLRNKKKGSAEA